VIALVGEESAGSTHATLSKLNDMAQSLGCASFPYTRTSAGMALNLVALKELLDISLELLESDAEVEISPPIVLSWDTGYGSGSVPGSGSASGGGIVWGNQMVSPTTSASVPPSFTPIPGRPAVGPQNSFVRKNIAHYAGWSDDLLADVDLQLLVREAALQAIQMHIRKFGYNPANFRFTIDVDRPHDMWTVRENVSGDATSITGALIQAACGGQDIYVQPSTKKKRPSRRLRVV
jgi:hypothetical protein